MGKICSPEYTKLLKEQLIPALGCTEPIAIAYTAAKAREVLGTEPSNIIVRCSGNIIKNAKSVFVPVKGGMRGIEASAALGALAGDATQGLEVLKNVREEELSYVIAFLKRQCCHVELLESSAKLDIEVFLQKEGHHAVVRVQNTHTNIVYVEKDGVVLHEKDMTLSEKSFQTDCEALNLKGILEYAENVELAEVRTVLERQIQDNMAIAEEGLRKEYGACIGRLLLRRNCKNDVRTRACAYAAAGSDARMNGCKLPVVINSGSGNQGIAASVPVVIYAKELNVTDETLLRALIISNLTAIWQKNMIGTLSAYCGAVCAACGAGAAITWMHKGRYEAVERTVINCLSILSGMVCDGAKSSCAAKIVSAVDTAILAYEMSMEGKYFKPGEGLAKKDAEEMISGIAKLVTYGMKETDLEILKLMIYE